MLQSNSYAGSRPTCRNTGRPRDKVPGSSVLTVESSIEDIVDRSHYVLGNAQTGDQGV